MFNSILDGDIILGNGSFSVAGAENPVVDRPQRRRRWFNDQPIVTTTVTKFGNTTNNFLTGSSSDLAALNAVDDDVEKVLYIPSVPIKNTIGSDNARSDNDPMNLSGVRAKRMPLFYRLSRTASLVDRC